MGGHVRGTQLAGAFIGSMIGAGFASGQEHLQFFLAFGSPGYWGLLVAGGIVTFVGILFLLTAYSRSTASHRDFLQAICEGPVALLFDILLTMAMLTSIAVMMSGGGALLFSLWALPPWVGSALMGLMTFFIVALGLERMLNVNTLLSLGLTVLILLVALWLWLGQLPTGGPAVQATSVRQTWVPPSWLAAAVLYASYNMTFCFSLFGSLGSSIRSARDAWIGGIVGGVVLTVLSWAVTFCIEFTQKMGTPGELPMLMAASVVSPVLQRVYVIGLWLAMLTTAITSTYTLTRRIAGWMPRGWGRDSGLLALVILIIATPVASFGFSHLVGTAYPLIGYVGGGCLVATFLSWRKSWVGR